jgi:hypothetical protein
MACMLAWKRFVTVRGDILSGLCHAESYLEIKLSIGGGN